MKRWIFCAIAALLALTLVWGFFGDLPSFLRNTTPVYLKPDTASGVEVGARVKRSGIDVGYVHNVELTIDGDVTIELRIFDNTALHDSDVCVIHRLHRYDTATLHIEPSMKSDASFGPLEDPLVMRCVIANGPWPKLPGLFEQNETK